MDPITTAITAAQVAQLNNVSYQDLKTLLGKKFGLDSDLIEAVDLLEQRPSSSMRQSLLASQIKMSQADQDSTILKAAQRLQTHVAHQKPQLQLVSAKNPPPVTLTVVKPQILTWGNQFEEAFIGRSANNDSEVTTLPVIEMSSQTSTQVDDIPTTPLNETEADPSLAEVLFSSQPESIKITSPQLEETQPNTVAISHDTILTEATPQKPSHQSSLLEQITAKTVGQQTLPPSNSDIEITMSGVSITSDFQAEFNIYTAIPSPPVVDLTFLDIAKDNLAELPTDILADYGPLPRGSRMPFELNPLFRGRKTELLRMAHAIQAGKTVVVNQPETSIIDNQAQITSDFGGIGKTQLVTEFVYRYGQYFSGGVFWLDFADTHSIPVEIIASGGTLASQTRPDFRNLLLEEQVKLVLSAWQSQLPRLLIFDNCLDHEMFERWRPPKGGCCIIVITRQTYWPASASVEQIMLEGLPPSESVDLLRQYRPDPLASDADVAGIATELGYMPLALHLAGNFLMACRNDVSLAKYLRRLRTFDIAQYPELYDYINNHLLTPHDYHVIRALMLSYYQLNSGNPTDDLAQKILRRAAFFAPGIPIPRELLLATLHQGDHHDSKRDFWGKLRGLVKTNSNTPDDPDMLMRAKDALARLVMLGLLELATDGALTLHPLICQILRFIGKNSIARQAVRKTIIETTQLLKETGSPTTLLAWQPHIQATIDMMEDNVQPVSLPGPFGQQLADSSNPTAWERFYYERALLINEQLLGENHPDTAQSLDNLGILACFEADYISARFYFERALAIRLAELGEDHPDTARSFNDFGTLLMAQGDYVRANDYYNQALSIRQTVLGEYHPEVGQCFNNLGRLYYEQGNYHKAQTYFQQALQINEDALGKYHPETARILNNLGSNCEAQADMMAAWFAYETAFIIFSSVLGYNHPDTATTLNNLGSLLATHQQYQLAHNFYAEALAIREIVLGRNHPDTAHTLHNLAILHFEEQDYETALTLSQDALTILQTCLPPQHHEVEIVTEALAKIKRQARPLRRVSMPKSPILPTAA